MNEVYLVTGSDKPKTVEQISDHTYNYVSVFINVQAVMFGKVMQTYLKANGYYLLRQGIG